MKKILYLVICAVLTNSVFAENISEQQAIRIASQFFNKQDDASARMSRAIPNDHLSLNHTLKAKDGRNNLYIINAEGNQQGFVVVAGETGTVSPILTFSDKGSINYENASENFKYWMKLYSEQIDYLRSHPNIASNADTTTQETYDTYIAPMITSRWGQGAPYNSSCPGLYTGCIATAMAQIMNYWKWPTQGRGHHTNAYFPEQSIDFSQSTYQWDKMQDSYTTGTESELTDAIAKLMGDCGASVDMDYCEDGSEAFSEDIPHALVCYFKYGGSTRLIEHIEYENTVWESMMFEELKAKRPILYGGYDLKTGGGHAFICDGYKKGYFHFNFGWNGLEDAFFRLDAINTSIAKLNVFQSAVVGIIPDYDGAVGDPSLIFSVTNTGNACLNFIVDTQNSITTLDVPETTVIDGNSYKVTDIGYYAFGNCKNITNITFPNTLKKISLYAFYGTALKSIHLPQSVKNIGVCAFAGCNNLQAITVDQSNPTYDSRENCNAIIEKSSLKLVQACSTTTFPKDIATIGENAFDGCLSLEGITIPSSVTQLEDDAFANCANLRYIHLPKSLEKIGHRIFCGCTSLTDVYNYATIPQSLSEDVFETYGTLHVEAACIDAYKAAESWKKFIIMGDQTDGLTRIKPNSSKTDIYDLSGRRTNDTNKGFRIKGNRIYFR